MARKQSKVVTSYGEFKLNQVIWYISECQVNAEEEVVVDCDLCLGAGWLINMLKKRVNCTKCNGRGTINSADLREQKVTRGPAKSQISSITLRHGDVLIQTLDGKELNETDVFTSKTKCAASIRKSK